MKLILETETAGTNNKMLLRSEHFPTHAIQLQSNEIIVQIYYDNHITRLIMEYNRLKLQVLSLFEETADSLETRDVLERIEKSLGLTLSDKAIGMALMRYWRQGLLERSRKSKRFTYNLTAKGVARREWLQAKKA